MSRSCEGNYAARKSNMLSDGCASMLLPDTRRAMRAQRIEELCFVMEECWMVDGTLTSENTCLPEEVVVVPGKSRPTFPPSARNFFRRLEKADEMLSYQERYQ